MTITVLSRETAGLVIVDAQTKLLGVMRRGQTIVDNMAKLLRLANLVHLPVIATEQNPRMMGPIAPDIRDVLPQPDTLKKTAFDCCAVGEFNDRLADAGVKSIILAGIETHICILQTCLSLLEAGYQVHIPQDAVDSRTEENWRVGLELMRDAGAVISSTETAIFQVMGTADAPEFKEMLRIIK